MTNYDSMNKISLILSACILLLFSCNNDNDTPDAFGNFQAKEYLISSEVSGKLMYKNFEEGSNIDPSEKVAVIDTSQLVLQRSELIARERSVKAKKVNIQAQIDVLKEQKAVLEKDFSRIKKMYGDGAATEKQVDDLKGNISVIDKQIASVNSNLISIDAEAAAIHANIEKVNDLLDKSVISPPISGSVLESYNELGELVVPNKPLFKMADMTHMELMAYISGDQLSAVKLGQEVLVKVDALNGSYKEFHGNISWISPQAEFTPKNIQTKKERTNQVYAMKVIVKNEGEIKINMPAEVYFN